MPCEGFASCIRKVLSGLQSNIFNTYISLKFMETPKAKLDIRNDFMKNSVAHLDILKIILEWKI